MIDFQRIRPEDRERFEPFLLDGGDLGCEYSFANLCMWGRQSAAVMEDHLVLFSQFNRRSVYPFPVGQGEKKPVLDAIIADSRERGIPCRITGLCNVAREVLERLYPGQFRFHSDRDSFDYVYTVDDLADLKGRKYQKKRNHYNRFRAAHPNYRVEPIGQTLLPQVQEMLDAWYEQRLQEVPASDFHMEQAALRKAMKYYEALGLDGLVLLDGGEVLAMTMGSFLSRNTVDVHFEKARADVDGAYTAINCEFARYIREKYPQVEFLDREEDMGIEGLRKAKESYLPHHMREKCWACLLEDGYDY